MAVLSSLSVARESCLTPPLLPPAGTPFTPTSLFNLTRPRITTVHNSGRQRLRLNTICAGISLGSVFKKCETCRGKGGIECPGCKGTGKNKKNGNIFERWKCFDCQGFGLKSCPECGQGGLTPEQRGER